MESPGYSVRRRGFNGRDLLKRACRYSLSADWRANVAPRDRGGSEQRGAGEIHKALSRSCTFAETAG